MSSCEFKYRAKIVKIAKIKTLRSVKELTYLSAVTVVGQRYARTQTIITTKQHPHNSKKQ